METGSQVSRRVVRRKRKDKKKRRKSPFILLLLLVIIGIFSFQTVQSNLHPYSAHSRVVEIEIPPGSTGKQISQILADNQLIRRPEAFYLYTRFKGLAPHLRAGHFTLDASWPLERIALALTKGGQGQAISFTIPEGYNLEQMARRLEELGLVTQEEFMTAAATAEFDYDFLKNLPQGENRLEGFLFPDTYQVMADADAEDIINLMLRRFNQVYDLQFQEREKELGLTTLEVITMASIVEREAKLNEERSTIAAVFYNRLQEKWRLQSCATVQYLLDEPREELLNRDLEIDSPYNTYKYDGLPPGPIAAPGKASIEAALYPAEVDYLFFRTDEKKGDGSHIFSRTFAEHNRAGQ